MNQEKTPLFDALMNHLQKDPISLHVPGHKYGNVFPDKGRAYYEKVLQVDVTELTGLDDLHDPEAAILEAEELLANLYGAKQSFFLVNGTTVGNLAMILSVCSHRDKVIVQRNCHKSVMNALILAGAKPIFLSPEFDQEAGVPTYIHKQTIHQALLDHSDAKAIVLTNPNYYGHTQDLTEIINMAHKVGIPVLVDEAHGAHFGLGESFPESALKSGADVVVQSAHKTLPAMTMGSYLHFQSNLVPVDKIKFYLTSLQSSSPSYPIMASLDLARFFLFHLKQKDVKVIYKEIQYICEEINKIPHIYCVKSEDPVIIQDPLKIIIRSRCQLSGYEIQSILEDVGLYTELADTKNVLCIVPLAVIDSEQIINKIRQAFKEVTMEICEDENDTSIYRTFESKVPFSYYELQKMKSIKVPLAHAMNKIAAQTVIPYPPGIPLLLQGEVITEEHLKELDMLMKMGAKIQGAINDQINIYEW